MPYVLECPRSLEQFSDMVKIYAKSVGKRPLLSPSPIVALAWRCSYCCLPSLKTTPPNSDHFDHSIATPFQLESHAPLLSTTIQQISVLQRNNRFILKRKDKTFCMISIIPLPHPSSWKVTHRYSALLSSRSQCYREITGSY